MQSFIQRGREEKVRKLVATLREHGFGPDLVAAMQDQDWIRLCLAAGVNAKKQPSNETKRMVLEELRKGSV